MPAHTKCAILHQVCRHASPSISGCNKYVKKRHICLYTSSLSENTKSTSLHQISHYAPFCTLQYVCHATPGLPGCKKSVSLYQVCQYETNLPVCIRSASMHQVPPVCTKFAKMHQVYRAVPRSQVVPSLSGRASGPLLGTFKPSAVSQK